MVWFNLQNKWLCLFFGVIMLFECSQSLKLVELRVPPHVPLGTRAALSCRWQLGPADVLYSLKWYKDGKEFFRHVPRDVEPRRKFPLPGVDVQAFDTTGSALTLGPATLETEGRYRCEVSGEGPTFPTVTQHSDMMVVVFSRHGPVLSRLNSKYHPGDRLMAICTSHPSRPQTNLGWYLNGEPLLVKPTHWTEKGLVTTTLKLDLRVNVGFFENNILKVKCLATITPVYWRSVEQTIQLDTGAQHVEKRNTALRFTDMVQVQRNFNTVVNAAKSLVYITLCCLIVMNQVRLQI